MLPSHFPPTNGLKLTSTRGKQLKHLEDLYTELGPYIVGVYSGALKDEIAVDVFFHESQAQFETAVKYLERLVTFCDEQCQTHPKLGRSDKLLALEELVLQQVRERGDAVGLIFVKRRATALALNEYFRRRSKAIETDRSWPSARELRNPQMPSPEEDREGELGLDGWFA